MDDDEVGTVALRVASFNVRTSAGHDGENSWRYRREACLTAIRELGADVVGLQEVRPDQLADLRKYFSDHTLIGEGRDAHLGDEHCTVLVAPTGWTVDSGETRWLSTTPDVPGSRGWDADLPRVATLVRLHRDEVRLGVADTHLDHIGEQARQRGAGLIAAWTGAESDRAWVVTGDLNCTPGSPPVRVLTEAGFADSLPPDAPGTEHAFTGSHDRQRIDYVLAGRGVRVLRAAVGGSRPGGRLPSDHWPVVADLGLSAPR